MREGLFLYTHNVSPYNGGVFHQASNYSETANYIYALLILLLIQKAPLLLPIFALIPPSAFAAITSTIYIVVDLLSTNALIQIAESGQAVLSRLFTSPRMGSQWDSVAIGAA